MAARGLTCHTSNTDVSLEILRFALWAVNVLFVHNDLPVQLDLIQIYFTPF